MGILNMDEYIRRLNSDNPVTIEELEDELKVLIKKMIEAATEGELTSHLGYEKNQKLDNLSNSSNSNNLSNGDSDNASSASSNVNNSSNTNSNGNSNSKRNYRNGYNKKNLKSKYGEIEVSIPRDRNSTFEPKLVRKRQRLLYQLKT